ncbi:RICIN domain-containing protein [Streptomyces sp. BR123]|uniref:RICIN domain-containing protein n=1 Tax=Streptomyces sp. BR123 TaxID=2749828 RepID=UPI0015C4DAC6|nr:RICIN domain-containing protein [Streptomyces sp. BR123]NXY96672.1 RICIN domain-containing protein [Streptomyces sp. BR123]
MTGAESGKGERPRGGGSRGDAYHGPAGVQRGSGNLQVNFHEHRTGILSACAVALVCVATVVAVRLGGGPGTEATAPPSHTATPAPAPDRDPGTAGADPSVLSGRLVNDDSGLCLRVTGSEDGLVPVQDECTAAADRTWTLDRQDDGATRTLRNGHSARCVTVAGPENHAPARQLACTGPREGRRWELLWGTGRRAGHFALRSIGNGKCLVVQGRATGRPAAQVSCSDEFDDQWWHLTP